MNKKGFTLIELLAAVTILAILAVVAFPAILSMVKGTNDTLNEDVKRSIESAAEEYVYAHIESFRITQSATDIDCKNSKEEEYKGCISVQDLASAGKIEQSILNENNINGEETSVKVAHYQITHKFEQDSNQSRTIDKYCFKFVNESCE